MSPHQNQWTFLTNHALVLMTIARDSGIRVRDVAAQVGITERATQRILAELAEAGYLEKTRVGRRNEYAVNATQPLRHPLSRDQMVGDLLDLLANDTRATVH